jgi:hypothetical protein
MIKRMLSLITLSTCMASASWASASTGPQAGRLVSGFTAFAGSTANAQSLVTGLRTGSSITLTDATGTSTTFAPATQRMGWGNVKISLALARAELAKSGITDPTPAEIQTALNGGTITRGTATTVYPGVLTQRASGMGWGQIAHSDGLNLGKVVSGTRPVTHVTPVVVASAQGTSMRVSNHHGTHIGSSGTGIVTASGTAGSAAATHSRSMTVVTAAGTTTAGSVNADGGSTVAAGRGAGTGSAVTGNGSQATGVTTAAGATSNHHGGGHGRGGS